MCYYIYLSTVIQICQECKRQLAFRGHNDHNMCPYLKHLSSSSIQLLQSDLLLLCCLKLLIHCT